MSATTKVLPTDPALAGESNVPRILGLGIAFHAFALISFGMRMYTRIFVVKAFGKDDLMMIFCMVRGIVTIAVATAHGLGRHAFTLSAEDQKIYGITVFIQAIFTTVTSLCMLKLSVAFSQLRLSNPLNMWWTRVIWGLMGETSTLPCRHLARYYTWISILAYCDPVTAHWNKALLQTARCWPIEIFRIFPLISTGWNIFTDICFATLPIPFIWRLRISVRARAYLIGVFSLGYI
ncbi:hypothetical protein P885DRAFT_44435 [Corynascus similis CBS 632.67]